MSEDGKLGRPSIYTDELADKICRIVATNPDGLPKLCKRFDEMPTPDTIKRWRWSNPVFSAKYAEAKRFQAEIMAESIEDIADEVVDLIHYEHGVAKVDSGIVALARLRVDSRKWHASKLAPKIYGDRVPESASVNNTVEVQERVNKINKESEKEF